MARVIHIFICPEKGQPMQEVREVEAVAGVGLLGDRYALGKGTYSGLPNQSDKTRSVRDITIISKANFDRGNRTLAVPCLISETRRNIVVDNFPLLELIAGDFQIGEPIFRGVEDCTPCTLPDNMAGKKGFKQAFQKLAGIRAKILYSGIIRVGDILTELD